MRSRLSSVLLIAALVLQVTVASLPHVHHDDGVRVGELHLGHEVTAGGGHCLVPPLELLPAARCLACSAHAPHLAAPAAAADGEPLASDQLVVASDRPPVERTRRWSVQLRGPPLPR